MTTAPMISALGGGDGLGLASMLGRSIGLITSFFTQPFLNTLGAQVDQNDLLLYITIIFAFWLAIQKPLRRIISSISDNHLGYRFNNLSLVDFFSQIIILLWFGILSNTVISIWSNGSFSIIELTCYGVSIAIIFFAFYTTIDLLFADKYKFIAIFENGFPNSDQQQQS